MVFVTDCLVLKIEEFDKTSEKLDTTLFIIYDFYEDNYVIRGKRADARNVNSQPYSFTYQNTESNDDLIHFIGFVLNNKDNYLSYTIYNYDNLPYSSNDITYEFLKNNESPEYEIVGYDNCHYSRKELTKILKMLKSVFNFYN